MGFSSTDDFRDFINLDRETLGKCGRHLLAQTLCQKIYDY